MYLIKMILLDLLDLNLAHISKQMRHIPGNIPVSIEIILSLYEMKPDLSRMPHILPYFLFQHNRKNLILRDHF